MPITTMDDLVDGLVNGETVYATKLSMTSQLAGVMSSYWLANGNPGIGQIPSVSEVCDRDTPGAILIPNHPTKNIHLAKWVGGSSVLQHNMLVDRLCHRGGLSGTSTSVQNCPIDIAIPASQARCDPNGRDVWWMLENYSNWGNTARSATIRYYNQNDELKTAPIVPIHGGFRLGQMLQIFPLAGDTIKSIVSLQLNGSTSTTGNVGVTAFKIYSTQANNIINVSTESNVFQLGIPIISKLACLIFICRCSATSSGNYSAEIRFALKE